MYDLVVLDLDMPVCDGYESCNTICKHFQDKVVQVRNKGRKSSGAGAGMMQDYIPIIVAVSGYIDDATEVKIE